ncbi:MAG: ATP-binding protein [Myxococcota bacterium]
MGSSSEADATAAGATLGPSSREDIRERVRARCRAAARITGGVLAALALAGMLDRSIRVFALEPLTHVGLFALGLLLVLPAPARLARIGLGALLAVGGLTVAVLCATNPGATDVAPMVGAALAVLGLAALLQESERRPVYVTAVVLSIVVLFASFTFAIGHFYGGEPELGLVHRDHISLPAAVAIGVAAFALRLARPDRGLLGMASDVSAASVQILVMLPAAVFGPPLIGGLYLLADRRGLVTPAVGQALVALATIGMLGVFVIWTARRIHRFESARAADAAALREARDQLERRVAERTAELAGATARWRAVLDSVNAAVVTVGADGLVTDFNRTAERWLGWSAADVIGKHNPTLWHDPDDLTRLVQKRQAELGKTFTAPVMAFVSGVRHGRPAVLECVYKRRDGSTFPVLLSVTRTEDASGRPTAYTGIAIDMQERLAIENALVQAKDHAEAATRARADFVARMSHELRTPLNGVLGFLALALDTELDAEQREFVSGARDAASSLLRLVDDILDFSKIDAQKLELESIPMTLSAVLDSSLRPLALRARNKGLTFEVDVADGVPDRLTGDPMRLGQVLVNLVANAVKFTQRGAIKVSVSVAEERPSAVLLRFQVKDSGIGIPRDKVAQVFEPFAQADEATTRRYGGTGLGLPISAELVRMMGGTIELDSVLGEGTTFTFTVHIATRAPTAVRPQPLVAARGMRVLLAEDNPTNLLLATRLLERAGHVVTGVTDGRAALEAVLGGGFDAVLMDVQMPELDGLEVTRAVREAERQSGQRVPIIGLTAQVQAGDDARCLEAGMDAYVPKPFDAHDLVAALDRVHPRPVVAAPAAISGPPEAGRTTAGAEGDPSPSSG